MLKALLTNTEIQRRLIEELPLLRAFKPFRDLADKGKAATNDEVQPLVYLHLVESCRPWTLERSREWGCGLI